MMVTAIAVVGGLRFESPGLSVARLASVGVEAAAAQHSNRPDVRHPDYFVGAQPDKVVWGGFPIDVPPVLTVQSGDTVRIDTISQSGATNGTVDPVAYFGQFGVKPGEVLQDVQDFWTSIPGRPRYGPHILTGPIYVEGAEPGDMLEVQILDLNARVPYGLNSTSPLGGVLGTGYPGFRPGDPGLDIPAAPPDAVAGIFPGVRQHLYRLGKARGREVAFFSRDIQVPITPFMGVMGVAPEDGVFVGSSPTSPPPPLGVQGS
jgi:acetamidase/formamidase